jgi:hypothetical protein
VTVKTPAPERQAGRRRLAKQGHALSDGSYPIPNRGYLKKAIRAVGRAGPGKRPALGRLIRKRARQLGAWSVVKGSWADNTAGAKTMAQRLEAALELARADGTLWELHHTVELVGPKGYIHGWIKVGEGHAPASAIPKVKKGQHVKADTHTHGKIAGVVTEVKPHDMLAVDVKRSDSGHTGPFDVHAGLVTHTRESRTMRSPAGSAMPGRGPTPESQLRAKKSSVKMAPGDQAAGGQATGKPVKEKAAHAAADRILSPAEAIPGRTTGTEAHAESKLVNPSPVSHTAHADLLKARTAARAQYPKGHPERLKAERAVRHSRKSRRAGEGSGGGGTTRVAGTSRASRRRQSATGPPRPTSQPSTGKSIAEHRAEVATLSDERMRAYYTARRQGIGHERAMNVARARPVPPKGTAAAKRPDLKAARKAPPKLTPVSRALGGDLTKSGQAGEVAQLAKQLEARGWSKSEARKIAKARILEGKPIPQFAPGKKGPRERAVRR